MAPADTTTDRPPGEQDLTAGVVRVLIRGAVLAGLAWVFLSSGLGVYQVPTGSMAPALLPGDVIAVNRAAYGIRLPLAVRWAARWSDPAPGDVVLFRNPKKRNVAFVKRVIGVPGQTVAFRDGVVVVDGVPARLTPLGTIEQTVVGCRAHTSRVVEERTDLRATTVWLDKGMGPSVRRMAPVEVPEGFVLVAGDHRDRSSDSRVWGLLAIDDVLGSVPLVLASYDMCRHDWRPERWLVGVP